MCVYFFQIDKKQKLLRMICLSRQVDGYVVCVGMHTRWLIKIVIAIARHIEGINAKLQTFMCDQNAMY